MAAVFFIHFIHSIGFCYQPNRNQVFSILGHVLSQFSKVINMNFVFGKLHLLTTQLLLHGTTHFIFEEITQKLTVFIVLIYIYIYIYIYNIYIIYIYYFSLNKSKIRLEKTFTLSEVILQKGYYQILKFSGKHLYQSLLFNEVTRYRPKI